MLSKDQKILFGIMIFYSILTYFIAPFLAWAVRPKKENIGYGIIGGSIISIFLWYAYGSKMVIK